MIRSVIYLEKTGFSFYQEGSTQLLKLDFLPEIVHDMDILGKDKFQQHISTFIQSSAIHPANIIIVLAENLLFEKMFPKPQAPALANQTGLVSATSSHPVIAPANTLQPSTPVLSNTPQLVNPSVDPSILAQKFLDNIPFENIGCKIISNEKGVRVIATNNDIYGIIKNSFELKGSIIDTVVPITIFEPPLAIQSGFTSAVALQVIAQKDKIRQNALLVNKLSPKEEDPYAPTPKPEPPKEKIVMTTKPSSKREFLLIGFFVVLLLFLGWMVWAFVINAPKPKPRLPLIPPITVTPTVTPEAVSLASESAKPFQIQIQTSAISASQAGALQTNLSKSFPQVELVTSTNTVVARTLVIFKSTVPLQDKETIMNAVYLLYPTATSLTNNDTPTDAIINLQSR